MSNVEIILNESIKLMDQGILKATDNFIEFVDPETKKTKKVPEPEEIHTYNGWKERGYQVQKGQKAKAAFPIWKTVKRSKKKNEDEDKDTINERMFLKNSFWFTRNQVEAI